MPKRDNEERPTGTVKGDFIVSPEVVERGERVDALPAQAELRLPSDRLF
jgi:hypothetical protein